MITQNAGRSLVATVLAVVLLIASAVFFLPYLASAHDGEKGSQKPSGMSITITNDGKTLVRGATVTNVSGNVITARTAWGDTNISWRIETDDDTDFVTRGQDTSTLSAVEVGNEMSFSGALDTDAGAFTVDADVVKNWSVDTDPVSYRGTVESINTNDTSFVLDTGNDEVTVEVTNDTKLSFDSNSTFADLEVGDTVSVTGFEESTSVITATKVSFEVKRNASKDWSFFGNWFRGFSFGHK